MFGQPIKVDLKTSNLPDIQSEEETRNHFCYAWQKWTTIHQQQINNFEYIPQVNTSCDVDISYLAIMKFNENPMKYKWKAGPCKSGP